MPKNQNYNHTQKLGRKKSSTNKKAPSLLLFPQKKSLLKSLTRRKTLSWLGLTGLGMGVELIAQKWLNFSKNTKMQVYNKETLDLARSNFLLTSNVRSVKTNKQVKDEYEFEVVTVNSSGEKVKLVSKKANYFRDDLRNGISLDMVSIPGGSFMMGTEDQEIERLVKKFDWEGFRREKPQHQVKIKPFFMGKYPITQKQWKVIASFPKVNHFLLPDPSRFKDDNLPVENVSWFDAIEFCQRLSLMTGKKYRLPTEAEWEYACRSGTTTPFHFGETITEDLANYDASQIYGNEPKAEEYRTKTTPVGSFPPNAFGLYDMHGNIWEWCEDDWHDNYNGAPSNGSANLSRTSKTKVVRGGSWDNFSRDCRSACRFNSNPFFRYNSIIGFRVACVAG